MTYNEEIKIFEKWFLGKTTWCKTEAEAYAFLELANKMRFISVQGHSLLYKTYWELFKENTGYRLDWRGVECVDIEKVDRIDEPQEYIKVIDYYLADLERHEPIKTPSQMPTQKPIIMGKERPTIEIIESQKATETIRIGKLDYTVKFVDINDCALNDGEYLGRINYITQTIYVANNLSKEKTREILTHEVTHGFLNRYKHQKKSYNLEDVCELFEIFAEDVVKCVEGLLGK